MPRDKRSDFAHAFEVAAREHREKGEDVLARRMESKANVLRLQMANERFNMA